MFSYLLCNKYCRRKLGSNETIHTLIIQILNYKYFIRSLVRNKTRKDVIETSSSTVLLNSKR